MSRTNLTRETQRKRDRKRVEGASALAAKRGEFYRLPTAQQRGKWPCGVAVGESEETKGDGRIRALCFFHFSSIKWTEDCDFVVEDIGRLSLFIGRRKLQIRLLHWMKRLKAMLVVQWMKRLKTMLLVYWMKKLETCYFIDWRNWKTRYFTWWRNWRPFCFIGHID